MKRLLILLSALLLCACVPTPEQEFVVSKADDTLEIRLSATAKPSGAPSDGGETPVPAVQTIPDRWTETFEANDTLTLLFDAEIVQKADGVCPVFRTKRDRFDQAKLAALLNALLPKPESVSAESTTKEQWADAYKAWLEQVAQYEAWVNAGRPDDGLDREELDLSPERIEAQSQWYMDRINEAPDEPGERAVSGYDAVPLYCNSVYTLESGEPVFVSANEDSLLFARGCRGGVCLYTETQMQWDKRYDDPKGKLYKDPSVTEADAKDMMMKELARIGLDGFCADAGQKTSLLDFFGDRHSYVESGWTFSLTRDFGGYPLLSMPFTSVNLDYGTVPDAYNAPILAEELSVFVNENGVRALSFGNPKAVVGLVNGNVELLPFEEAKTRIKNALSVCYPVSYYQERGEHVTLEVYRIVLTTQTLHAKDSDEYYEMPCFVVYFDCCDFEKAERDNPIYAHSAIVINAVDGSTVVPGGY
jgi:hypothetical protein